MPETVTVLSATTSLAVAAICAVVAVIALRARRATGREGLGFVAAGFFVFVVKNAFSAFNVLTHVVAHESLELVLSLFDLVAVFLLFAPILRRTTAP